MNNDKNTILAGLSFGVLMGLFLALRIDTHYAIIAGSTSGLAFGALLYYFGKSKSVARHTQIHVNDGETVIYSGRANHFLNGEAVGGKLYLLANRLQFQSHGFNIQNHGLVVELSQIQEVGFYNVYGLVPNGLVITTSNGQTEKFVVNGRQQWKSEIEKLKG